MSVNSIFVKMVLLRLFWSLTFVLLPAATTLAAPRFTEKQIEALQRYVGKTYWIAGESERGPLFLSAPSPKAASSSAVSKEAFQITELLPGPAETLYYKAKFPSGKEAYINVDTFLEELNSALVTREPDRGQKSKAAEAAEEESRREEWIRAQPWPENVKQAALKRQAILGMNTEEVKVTLGKPSRIIRLSSVGRFGGRQEQWIYPGSTLTFTNGVLTLIQNSDGKTE
jgi:hypothetical protein